MVAQYQEEQWEDEKMDGKNFPPQNNLIQD
jgi:hypothetical protein